MQLKLLFFLKLCKLKPPSGVCLLSQHETGSDWTVPAVPVYFVKYQCSTPITESIKIDQWPTIGLYRYTFELIQLIKLFMDAFILLSLQSILLNSQQDIFHYYYQFITYLHLCYVTYLQWKQCGCPTLNFLKISVLLSRFVIRTTWQVI